AGPIGFAPASRDAQAAAEARALAVPTPDAARAWLRGLTEEPHVAGTPADYKTAVDLRDKLASWGWTAEIAEYEVLLNYPVPGSVKLEVLRPAAQPLKITEDANPADKDSASPDAFPAFHGYGVSGDVAAQVVYANYGRPEDFATLEGLGVDVRGKIVLVRYGEIFRGLKLRNAQKRGARGLLIFSDPADDGYGRGDVYPNGPYRPGSALQRGSVQFLSLGPGDPSTPNGPSVKNAKRIPFDELDGFTLNTNATVLNEKKEQVQVNKVKEWEKATGLIREDYFATIPSLPIGYDAARPILQNLGGPNAPNGWQGGLPLPYHVGPGPSEVHFAVTHEYKVRTIWNVVATIKGAVEPDRWVMIGNHRDAWVYGAVDPSSGTASTMEMCRALGEAVKAGWKPRRTLVYASWDAEEYGLVGSTEWADEHAADIDQKAVLMLNVDSAVSGPNLDLDGVPSMRDFLLEAAAGVTDVRSGRSLREVWVAKQRAAWAGGGPLDLDETVWNGGPVSAASLAGQPRSFAPQLNPLGSGSDYTAFVDHLGVPAIDVGFTGRYGVYHSIYDDFFWMEKFGDPEFVTHATAARLYTLIAMRAAGAEVVPLKFTGYGDAVRDHVDDLRRMVVRKVRAVDPGAKPPIEFAGLPRLVEAVKNFQALAVAADRSTSELASKDGVAPEKLARVNDALTRVERTFLVPAGLPGRPWFKHSIYAPGLTTGYSCWPLPGVRQAVNDNDAALLAVQVAALVERLDAASAALNAVVKLAADEPKPPRAAEPAPAPKPVVGGEPKPEARPGGPER
ncbi:MAG TPA: M28 family metallopeptidase, partial [Isosphaeraceae bacterium]|nr:M28 family metallopeptidase [Isosphaeraceae bacterium]